MPPDTLNNPLTSALLRRVTPLNVAEPSTTNLPEIETAFMFPILNPPILRFVTAGYVDQFAGFTPGMYGAPLINVTPDRVVAYTLPADRPEFIVVFPLIATLLETVRLLTLFIEYPDIFTSEIAGNVDQLNGFPPPTYGAPLMFTTPDRVVEYTLSADKLLLTSKFEFKKVFPVIFTPPHMFTLLKELNPLTFR